MVKKKFRNVKGLTHMNNFGDQVNYFVYEKSPTKSHRDQDDRNRELPGSTIESKHSVEQKKKKKIDEFFQG
jgi:hypothetical protein